MIVVSIFPVHEEKGPTKFYLAEYFLHTRKDDVLTWHFYRRLYFAFGTDYSYAENLAKKYAEDKGCKYIPEIRHGRVMTATELLAMVGMK